MTLFSITVNSYRVSVQFAGGNYCDNYGKDIGQEPVSPWVVNECENAEIAVIRKKDINSKDTDRVTKEVWAKVFPDDDSLDDDVVSSVTPENVAKIIAYVSSLK